MVDADGALGVGEELVDGGAQLAQVAAQGVDEGTDGLGGDASSGAAHVGHDQGGLVLGALDGLALDGRVWRGLDGVQQALAPLAPVVAQDDADLGVGSAHVGDEVAQQGVSHLLQGGDVDEPGLTEQGGRHEGVELVGLVGGGLQARDLGGGVLGLGLRQEAPHCSVGEDLLAGADEDDRRQLGLVPPESCRCLALPPGAGGSGRCHGASLP